MRIKLINDIESINMKIFIQMFNFALKMQSLLTQERGLKSKYWEQIRPKRLSLLTQERGLKLKT